jgi:predicted acyl esterase
MQKPLRRAVTTVLVLLSFALVFLILSIPSALACSPPSPVAGAVNQQSNVPVRMSDGVVLYVDVVRPADASGNPLPGRYALNPESPRRPLARPGGHSRPGTA